MILFLIQFNECITNAIKVSFLYGGSYIDSPDWLKKRTVNPKNTDDKCFQYAGIAALYYEEIKCSTALRCGSFSKKHQKKKKTLRNCQYLVKTTLVVYLIFDKLIFFETLIIFLESKIKSITGIFDLQK